MAKVKSMTPIEMSDSKVLFTKTAAELPAKELKPERKSCRAVRAFLGFGFIFGLNFCAKPSKSTSTRLIITGICLVIWLWPWLVLYYVLTRNFECYQNRDEPVLSDWPQCIDNYFIFNYVSDAILGIVCATGLLINRGTIAQLFEEMLEIFEKCQQADHTESNAEKSKEIKTYKIKMSVMSGFMIFFSIILPVMAVLANGMLEIITLTGSNKVNFILSVIKNIPSEILSTYFCMMYALVCYILNVHLTMFQQHAKTMKHPDFSSDSNKLQRMVRLTEAGFNQILPVVYFMRISTMINFFLRVNQNSIPLTSFPHYVRLVLLTLHAVQLLLIVIPPSLFNSRVNLPIQRPPISTIRGHPIGVYSTSVSYERSVPSSENVAISYLTVGGIPISLWILVLAIGSGMIAVLIENNITVALNDFQMYVRKQFKLITPPKPKPCPTLKPTSCPTCSPLSCVVSNVTAFFDNNNTTATDEMNTTTSIFPQTTTPGMTLAGNYTSTINVNITANATE